MKIELSGEAQRQVSEIDFWWRANRDKSPNLFALVLIAVDALARVTP